jgi:hypothetical protein
MGPPMPDHVPSVGVGFPPMRTENGERVCPVAERAAAMMLGMMLVEPGSRIEGATEPVLSVVFVAAWHLFRETMTDDKADALALRLLGRIHEGLADEGYVVRDSRDD